MTMHRTKGLQVPQNWAGLLPPFDGAVVAYQQVFAANVKSNQHSFKGPGFLDRFQLIGLDL